MKRSGTSMNANTASDPPTTNAAQRRRAANAGQRNQQERRDRDRPASREDLRREAVARLRADVELARVLLERALDLLPVGRDRPVSATIGSNQSMKNAAGTASAASTTLPGRRSCLVQSARTSRNPTNGIHRKIAYVGWTTASTRPAAAVEAKSPRDGACSALSASASAAGTRSCRDDVAGRARNAYAPPRPGRKADHRRLRAGDGARRPGRAEQRPAGLVRDDHRERLRGPTGGGGRPAPGRFPETRAMSARKPCQSGKA